MFHQFGLNRSFQTSSKSGDSKLIQLFSFLLHHFDCDLVKILEAAAGCQPIAVKQNRSIVSSTDLTKNTDKLGFCLHIFTILHQIQPSSTPIYTYIYIKLNNKNNICTHYTLCSVYKYQTFSGSSILMSNMYRTTQHFVSLELFIHTKSTLESWMLRYYRVKLS